MMLEHALDYAAAGWRVLPLRETLERGKAPYVAGGVHSATTDVDIVRDWWRRWPNAMIGASIPPGVVVIDVDPRNGGSLEALESLNDGQSTPTLAVRTGGGGWHFYYSAPLEVAAAMSDNLHDDKGRVVAGIDVIKPGKKPIVLPPSIHPETGKAYEWANSLPAGMALPALPDALARAAQKPLKARKKTKRTYTSKHREKGAYALIRRFEETTKEGNRNSALFSLACKFCTERHSVKVFNALGTAALRLGLPRAEVLKTLESAQHTVGWWIRA